jgi:formylmethanofuran dehydrogenase subunit B
MRPMTDDSRPWTCPFCPLLCDGFGVSAVPGRPLALTGSSCARAVDALARFDAQPAAAQPSVRGLVCDLETAVGEAARRLAASRQPLFGGLGTDVAGARALYSLACTSGAICDAGQGPLFMQGVRALQDRGGFSTTLAEMHTRADFVLCVGGLPSLRHPEFFKRIGLAADDARVLVLDAEGEAGTQGAEGAQGSPSDLFDLASRLAALVEGRTTAGAPAALVAAAERLKAASYAVLVYETARLGEHGALIVEMLQRVVATLNRSTRAAALALGGADGAATVNQVFTWLSGLPLRSRVGPHGLEHEPLSFDAARLCQDGAVDLLLWVASFGTEAAPPAHSQPCIVIGHPSLSALDAEVFIPVSTPAIGCDGHLFRTDGVVLMPLHAARPDTLPSAAAVLRRLAEQVSRERAADRTDGPADENTNEHTNAHTNDRTNDHNEGKAVTA